MLSKVVTSLAVGSALFGAASAAWAEAPSSPPAGKSVAIQPNTAGEGAQSPGDVPPPALPNPVKKKSFFPIAGLGLLAAAGAGAAVAASDNNPASP